MQHILTRLGEERGAAMTEFVITLPIFIMIFAGMGMLHRYGHEGLIARMKTNQILVDRATAPNTIPGFVPGVGGVVSIQSFGDVAINGSGALGMYYDSWVKTSLIDFMIPGQPIPAPASPPKNNIEDITGMTGLDAPDSFTNMLLNDLANPSWDSSGWANILASVVQTFGVAPSLFAGIRYEPIQAETSHTFSHPWTGSMTYNPGRLQLASPTAAHHRVGPVAASRVAMNTIEPYKECILQFENPLFGGNSPCMDGNPAANTDQMDNVNAAAQACADQSEVWQGCMDACGDPATSPSFPSFPSGAPVIGCYTCNCHCDGSRPEDSCEDVGASLGGNVTSGLPGSWSSGVSSP